MGQRVNLHSLLKPIGVGTARASLHEAWQHTGISYIIALRLVINQLINVIALSHHHFVLFCLQNKTSNLM